MGRAVEGAPMIVKPNPLALALVYCLPFWAVVGIVAVGVIG